MNNEWTIDERETLAQMRNKGYSTRQIAEELDKSFGSVKMYLQRHRDELGVEKRPKYRSDFDKAWCGVIPLGHWLITKPWGKSCDVKPVTRS